MPDQRSMADLLRLGSAQREDALLQAQMAQAAQMAQPRGRVYGTAGGAIMGGLSDGLREMAGGFRQQGLQRDATEAERGRVGARQQWLSAALRGQQPPAGMAPEPSPQEQAAGMAAALRGEQPTADALTKLAPYQAGPLLGGGAAPSGAPAAPLAPPSGFAGQTGGPGAALRAKLAGPINTPMPAGQMSSPAAPRPMMSAPAVEPRTPAQDELPEMTLEQMATTAIGSGDPAMMAWGKTVLDQANMRETLGARRQEQEAKTKGDADAAAAKQKAEADKFGHEQRDKMMALPAIRNAMDSRIALDKIQEAAASKSPMGDIAMVYGVITTFDPKSGVKEGEVALSAEAQGFVSKLEALYGRLKAGTRLTDDVRADIVATAKRMYLAQKAPALQLAKEYDGYLERAGLNPREYLPDLGFESTPKAPKAKAGPPAAYTGPNGRRAVLQPDGTYEVE